MVDMLDKNDKKWIKEAIIEGVVGGLNEVMIPAMEDMEKRLTARIDGNAKKIDKNADRIDRLDMKVSLIDRRLSQVSDYQGGKLNEYGKEIEKLQSVVA